jgi:hypothetical protein
MSAEYREKNFQFTNSKVRLYYLSIEMSSKLPFEVKHKNAGLDMFIIQCWLFICFLSCLQPDTSQVVCAAWWRHEICLIVNFGFIIVYRTTHQLYCTGQCWYSSRPQQRNDVEPDHLPDDTYVIMLTATHDAVTCHRR